MNKNLICCVLAFFFGLAGMTLVGGLENKSIGIILGITFVFFSSILLWYGIKNFYKSKKTEEEKVFLLITQLDKSIADNNREQLEMIEDIKSIKVQLETIENVSEKINELLTIGKSIQEQIESSINTQSLTVKDSTSELKDQLNSLQAASENENKTIQEVLDKYLISLEPIQKIVVTTASITESIQKIQNVSDDIMKNQFKITDDIQKQIEVLIRMEELGLDSNEILYSVNDQIGNPLEEKINELIVDATKDIPDMNNKLRDLRKICSTTEELQEDGKKILENTKEIPIKFSKDLKSLVTSIEESSREILKFKEAVIDKYSELSAQDTKLIEKLLRA